MTIAANFPAIRPSLNLDFANTKTLDPRIAFGRASAATYYDGKTVAKAEENLLTYSQQITAGVGAWAGQGLATGTAINSAQAPDITVTASTINVTSGAGGVRYYSTIPAGTYTVSVYIRSVSGSTDFAIDFENLYSTSFTLSSVWQRVTATVTFAVTRAWIDFQISAPGIFEIWGAQLEQRAQATAYTPTTTQPITNYIPVLLTAPAGVPRFDHNPITGESLGLLIEEQRTNLLTYSEQFDVGIWSRVSTSVQPNSCIAPDGTLTADKLVAGSQNSSHSLYRGVAQTSGASTASTYIKKAGYSRVRFYLNDSVTGDSFMVVDLDSESIVQNGLNGSWSAASWAIAKMANGWFKLSVTGTQGAGTSVSFIVSLQNSAGAATFAGDDFSGIYIWGAQLEAGAFPTSYIKTDASQVTRAADTASMTGTNFSSWFVQGEGTLLAEARNVVNATVFSTAVLTDDQALQTNNRIALFNRPKGVVGAAALISYQASEQIANSFTFKDTNKVGVAY